VEWFGKSGIAWHGSMFIRRYNPADGGEVNPDEYVIFYYDDITVGRCKLKSVLKAPVSACCFL
jgi:hypothetical protein